MASFGSRQLWTKYMTSAIKRNVGVTATIAAGRTAGMSTFRHTDMLAKYRELERHISKAVNIRFTPKSYRPATATYLESDTFMRKTYRYTAHFEYRSGKTNEIVGLYQGVSSDRQLTIGEIEDIARQGMDDVASETGGQILSLRIVDAIHRRGDIW